MRVFVACIYHEASTFSPIPSSRKSFEEFIYHSPMNGEIDDYARNLNGYGAFIRRAENDGHEVFGSLYTFAQPSGPTNASDYESLRDHILNDLKSFADVDLVYLFLHGAQLAQGYDDCEGDILHRVRAIVGEGAFIGALLDLHANISNDMVKSADILAACRHYPHIDFDERAEHLYEIGVAAYANPQKPKAHFIRVPMLAMHYTTLPGMEQINATALQLQEQSGVYSVSLIHGFPWADIEDAGAGVLAYTNGNVEDVEDDLERLARQFFGNREETRTQRQFIDDILDEIENAEPKAPSKPFVIADACDNPGGGAGGDSTFVIERILERNLQGYALALLWDPIAAQFAADAGVGASLRMRIGGKTGPRAGDPLDVDAKVLSVRNGVTQKGIGFDAPVGLAAALEIRGNVVIVNSVRGQVFNPSCFTDLGIETASKKALVVKSSQHFYDEFALIARKILYCETPGELSLFEFCADEYSNLRRPIWPIDNLDSLSVA